MGRATSRGQEEDFVAHTEATEDGDTLEEVVDYMEDLQLSLKLQVPWTLSFFNLLIFL